MAKSSKIPFQQDQYWLERHRIYAGDARSVGNVGLSHEDNLRGDQALATAIRILLQETGARSIIDLGCGYGRVCRAIAGSDIRYTGIDISPVAIETARASYPDREFAVGNLDEWTPRHRADLVLCIYTLSTFVQDEEWRRLLSKAAGAVNDGGYLVVCDHMPRKTQLAAQHVTFRSPADIASELSLSGFAWNDRVTTRVAKEMNGGLALDLRIASREAKSKGSRAELTHATSIPDALTIVGVSDKKRGTTSQLAASSLAYSNDETLVTVTVPGRVAAEDFLLSAQGETCAELKFLYNKTDDLSVASVEKVTFWRFVWKVIRAEEAGDVPFTIHSDQLGSFPVKTVKVKRPAVRGKIETSAANSFRGWAVATNWPVPLDIRILVNDVVLFNTRASIKRADLGRNKISTEFGGLQLGLSYNPLPRWDQSEAKIDFVWALNNQQIATTVKSFGDLPQRKREGARWSTALSALGADKRKLSIIVPVHNAVAETRRCIDSLLRLVEREAADIIVIDDCSTDPSVWPLLETFARTGRVKALRNEVNLGFSGSINRGILAAAPNDVLLLNSDTVMPRGTLRQLRLAAYSSRRVATVTPLSNNAGPFSVECRLAPEATFDEVDHFARLVRQASLGLLPRVPTGHGFCLYVRRDCLDEVGTLDADAFPQGYGEENEFCMRALRNGWVHLLDDRSFVLHVQGASFSSSKAGLLSRGRQVVDARYPEYTSVVRREFGSSDIEMIGARISLALADYRQSSPTVRPRILFVISKETGGTPQTNMDLMSRLQGEYETFVLRCDGASVYLEIFDGKAKHALESSRLAAPVDAVSHRSSEYDDIVTDWLVSWSIDVVHVRHLGWHGLGLVETARDLGIKCVFSFHDFYVVCPTIKLLDNDRRYCAGNCTAGDGVCKVELWKQEQFPYLKHRWVVSWKSIFGYTLEKCDAFVTTSDYAKEVISGHFPFTKAKTFPVIRHGRDFDQFFAAAALSGTGEPLRILVPGNIGVAKGSELISAVRRLDVNKELEFHVIGNVDKGLELDGINLHGSYDRDSATRLFHKIDPHIGAIFSIWPETYCHTLTELWSAGIPTLGFDIGAVGERLHETGAGWLLPISSPQQVFDYLMTIKTSPSDHAEKCAAVRQWQEGEGMQYGTDSMATRYKEVYQRVLLEA